jgi:hypothetical protein
VCAYVSQFYTDIYLFMQLPDYHEVIQNPMDFGTLRNKLASGAYANLEQFEVGLCSSGFIFVLGF